jgi:CRP-like cAMP-binding protein
LDIKKENDILGPGDLFGIVSAMSSNSHIETAQALEDVILVVVHRTQYSELIQKNPHLSMKIMLQFSSRLRHLNESFLQLTLKSAFKVDESDFFAVGEYYDYQGRHKQAFHAYAKYIEYYSTGENVTIARKRLTNMSAQRDLKFMEFNPNEANRIYPDGTMLFAEGEVGREMFIIQKGTVRIVRVVNNKEVLLAMLKEGDVFGEMSLLETKPRTASAVTDEGCQVLVVNHDSFKLMISDQPQLIAKITTILANRIWSIYKQLIKMHEKESD